MGAFGEVGATAGVTAGEGGRFRLGSGFRLANMASFVFCSQSTKFSASSSKVFSSAIISSRFFFPSTSTQMNSTSTSASSSSYCTKSLRWLRTATWSSSISGSVKSASEAFAAAITVAGSGCGGLEAADFAAVRRDVSAAASPPGLCKCSAPRGAFATRLRLCGLEDGANVFATSRVAVPYCFTLRTFLLCVAGSCLATAQSSFCMLGFEARVVACSPFEGLSLMCATPSEVGSPKTEEPTDTGETDLPGPSAPAMPLAGLRLQE
mmetsp:Transcript_22439/g.40490  ORF Transcript_22439/g.40490 Transcript_22439/m.40490 type:complete len:265 (+) Transcript_22439:627-1421(+)